jgi:transcriptional regulator with XRE-family HTH domain
LRKYRFVKEHIYIARLENGSRVPNASYLANLASVLSVDINYFYVRENAYE